MKYFKKIILGIKSILVTFIYKLMYRKLLYMGWINSIRGKIHIEIFASGKIIIGKFLMSRGPLYLKCTENAQLVIGDNCFFNHNCSITSAESIKVGDGCIFANNVVIVDHDHLIEKGKVQGELKSGVIEIGNNVWCGANVTILKNVTIGDGAVIAAGAVVNNDIPAYELWGGIPAHKIKNLKYGEQSVN